MQRERNMLKDIFNLVIGLGIGLPIAILTGLFVSLAASAMYGAAKACIK